MAYIYVLLLKDKKYYVGKTDNPEMRLDDHISSNGPEWTRIHKPVKLVSIERADNKFSEDVTTFQYMDKYGLKNVRGGAFTSVELDASTMDILTRILDSANNRCFACGSTSHYTDSCNLKNDKYADSSCEDVDEGCYRCGRHGHYAADCYAKTHVTGYYL